MKRSANQTGCRLRYLVLLSVICIASLSACSAEMAKTMIDGIVDGARVGVHDAIDAHFNEVSEPDELVGSASEFEDLF